MQGRKARKRTVLQTILCALFGIEWNGLAACVCDPWWIANDHIEVLVSEGHWVEGVGHGELPCDRADVTARLESDRESRDTDGHRIDVNTEEVLGRNPLQRFQQKLARAHGWVEN